MIVYKPDILDDLIDEEISTVAHVVIERMEDLDAHLSQRLFMETIILMTGSITFATQVMKETFGIESKPNIFDPVFAFTTLPAVSIVIAYALTLHLKRRSEQLKLLQLVTRIIDGNIRKDDISEIKRAYRSLKTKRKITKGDLKEVLNFISEGSEF